MTSNFENPIKFVYPKPTNEFIQALKSNAAAVKITPSPRLLLENRYYRDGIPGSFPVTYIRASLLQALEKALALLPTEYGFVVFDAYRSKETQKGLFETFSLKIADQHPDWTSEQLYIETRKFVAHPDEPSRFAVPPHNSGGAIDIGLTLSGSVVDMGTGFDDLTDRASTDFFEKPYDMRSGLSQDSWESSRRYRRILFHSLRAVGFTNWKYEWWHYDMGNCIWSQELGIPFFYDSMKLPT